LWQRLRDALSVRNRFGEIELGVMMRGFAAFQLLVAAASLGLFEALAADPGTEVIVVVSKPPHPDVLSTLEASLAAVPKPVVVCALGLPGRPARGAVRWVSTLVDAAEAAAAAARARPWVRRLFIDPPNVRGRLERLWRAELPRGSGILGLFTGGTLAHEARLVLEPLVGAIGDEDNGRVSPAPHRILDLGADAYTVGRPHPMIDAAGRAERIAAAGEARETGVVLLDLVLGKGALADPAGPVAAAVVAARRRAASRGRGLAVVASVVGTSRDPQGLEDQVVKLESVGVEVLSSNAEAARFAALLLRPELAGTLLEASR